MSNLDLLNIDFKIDNLDISKDIKKNLRLLTKDKNNFAQVYINKESLNKIIKIVDDNILTNLNINNLISKKVKYLIIFIIILFFILIVLSVLNFYKYYSLNSSSSTNDLNF
tara:strand:- start:617 stop:949 length:333 start_codon:yes stop_codon:yes gene_type:complete